MTATPATGSPWWVDSLEVKDGETLEIAFVADNPGIWMDHCHNLTHAAEGLVAHLMYTGVESSYRVGGDAGQPARVTLARRGSVSEPGSCPRSRRGPAPGAPGPR